MLYGAGPPRPREDAAEAAPVEIDGVLRGEYVGSPDNAFFLLRKRYALDHAVGDIPLGEALRCGGREIALSACNDALLGFDPRAACFMDTETTGLAGGAGTVAFLVGMGFFEGQAFAAFKQDVSRTFHQVRTTRPSAVRKRSREVYVVGLGKKEGGCETPD